MGAGCLRAQGWGPDSVIHESQLKAWSAGLLGRYCFVVALGYLSLCQVTRVYIFDYGMYSADFTGDGWAVTSDQKKAEQKGLARKDEQLTPSQRRLAVRRMPSLLEYFSYNCNFMGILVGPTSSYKDYIAFIEGTAYHSKYSETNGKENGKYKQSEPSPKMEVFHKLAVCAISLLVYLTVSKSFSVERNVDDAFIASTPFYTRVIYLYLSMLTTRPKYYFAWTLAWLNGGRQFRSKRQTSKPSARRRAGRKREWARSRFGCRSGAEVSRLMEKAATPLSAKKVCYERCPYNPTAATFLLSAIWHGVYPGYYLTFLTGIVMTKTARAIRHNVRQYFLGSSTHKLIYDVITGAGTQIAISYTVVPFVLLSVPPSLKFYK
ncbi:UNVERIFIED_CONTAM: hypothetical protein FKN15_046245 [Acipenser sinensis]